MKKYLFLLLSLLAIAIGAKADVEINSENFPDDNFRNYLLDQDYGKDGIITDSEMADIAVINVPVMGIQSLRGIKYFTSMTALYIHRNNINENEMEHLVRELPEQSGATLYAYYFGASDERNYMNYLQRSAAQAKGWNVLMWQYASEGYAYILSLFDYAPNNIAVYATPEYFPDEDFRNALKEEGIGNFYASIPYITREDVENTKVLDLWNIGITSLTGIQFFTALEELECSYNYLTALDVSKNTKLTKLYCCSNRLTALDVLKNTELTYMDCRWNQLTALDVTKNTELIEFLCGINQLTSLDVSKNTELTQLDCSMNQLTALDVSKNTKLIRLYCNNNLLTALNVSKNTELEQLYCDENQIKGAAMDNLIVSLRPKVININKELKFAVVTNGNDEGNVCTKQQVNAAKNRGWTPYYYDYNLNKYKPYNGPYPKEGDVNNDNSVDVADISTVIDVMAGRAHWYKAAADVNDDGNVDVADAASIIDVMAGKAIVDENVYTACPNDHHPHWIDLGLPSGTQWRCCNKGASTPEAYGGYYTFSETVSAPTAAQLRELVNECSSERTTLNGVWGKAFVGPNGGTIFLPASGYKDDEAVRDTGRDGKYWSETPFEAFGGSALSLYLNSIDTIEGIYRLSVRPVR